MVGGRDTRQAGEIFSHLPSWRKKMRSWGVHPGAPEGLSHHRISDDAEKLLPIGKLPKMVQHWSYKLPLSDSSIRVCL